MLNHIRVAVVEDNDRDLQRLTGFLEQYQTDSNVQFDLAVFRDGRQFLQDSGHFDLLLMLLSQAVFLLHCPRRKPFFPRCAAAFAGFLAAASALDAVFGRLPQTVPFRITYFLLLTSFSLPAIRFSFQLSIRKATFIAVAGYSLQHIADSILKILQTIPAMAQIHWLLTTACVYAAVLSLGYLVFTKGAQLEEAMRYGDWRVLAVSWMNLVMCLGISVVIDDLALKGTVLVICKIYAILGCLLCLCFQVGLFQNGRMAQEAVHDFSANNSLAASLTAMPVTGAAQKGAYTDLKHFALNDQETARGGIVTYCTEQALRELWLLFMPPGASQT